MPFFKTKEEDEAGEDQESMLDSKESKKKGFKSKLHPNKLKKSIKNIDASKHVDKLKGSMKWISWVTKKVRQRGAAFPLFMIGINTLYLVLGGLIFMAIEKTPKVEYNTSKELVNIFDILKVSVAKIFLKVYVKEFHRFFGSVAAQFDFKSNWDLQRHSKLFLQLDTKTFLLKSTL